MSEGWTPKVVFDSGLIRAETMPDDSPLERPIFFRYFRNGCYITVAEAQQIAHDLTRAVQAIPPPAREKVSP